MLVLGITKAAHDQNADTDSVLHIFTWIFIPLHIEKQHLNLHTVIAKADNCRLLRKENAPQKIRETIVN